MEVSDRSGKARVIVEDNGLGIVEGQIARIFGKMLYGSKFHKLSQSRGQQGMGLSAAGMYGQLTVGKPLHIISRVKGENHASEMHVSIDTARNQPDIHRKKQLKWDRPHGTRVEMEMEGHYQKGPHSVEVYLKQTAIANPHLSITYKDPQGQELHFVRSIKKLPPRPVEIKPHPYGIELGRLIQMLNNTKSRTLLGFLVDEFSCVGTKTARKIIELAGAHSDRKLSDRSHPKHIAHVQAAALHRAIQKTRIQAPRTDCIVPIGEKQLLDGLHKELEADFFTVTTRPAAAYRGNPFQVEVAIAYGRPGGAGVEVDASGHLRKQAPDARAAENLIAQKDEPARLLRFANRVPLALPAGQLRDHQGCHPNQLAGLWPAPAERIIADRANGDPGPCRVRLGALHLRIQGGHRALSGNPQRDQTRAARMRAQARALSAPRDPASPGIRPAKLYREISSAYWHLPAGHPRAQQR